MTTAFSVLLQDLRDGRTHDEMSQKFAALVKEVEASGRSGTLTLTIKVSPSSRSQPVDKIIVSPTVKLTPPKPESGEDFFWLTEDSELSRNHPRQTDLPLRDVNSKPAEFKEAAK
jgi:hypothetical protein